jgi:hypothetical protein
MRPWLFFVLLCVLSLFIALWLRGGTDARLFAIWESMVDGLCDWYSELRIGSDLTSDTLPPAGLKSGIDTSKTVSKSRTEFSPYDHTVNDHQACNRPHTKSRSDVDTKLIYKWVDKGGQTHMSDQQPKEVIASVMDLGMKNRDFTYQIIPDGVVVPTEFSGQLFAGSKRIYDTWHFLLGEQKLRQSRIEVLLIGGPDRFDAYHAKASPGSKRVNGFYDMGRNLAIVKFDPANQTQALRSSFHEISHLVTAGHLGRTPPWLTEGLAEYFETMQVKDQTGAIYPNQAHINLLKKTPLPSLKEYLSIDRPEWHGAERDRNYAIAWSLINFLLQGAPGMYALQQVIQQAEANFCQPFSVVDALDQAYPGGLERLEQDWRKWLADDQFQIQQA